MLLLTIRMGPPEKIREAFGVSQSEFAEYFEFSVRTLQEWEQGRSAPRGVAKNFLILLQREPEIVRNTLLASDIVSKNSPSAGSADSIPSARDRIPVPSTPEISVFYV